MVNIHRYIDHQMSHDNENGIEVGFDILLSNLWRNTKSEWQYPRLISFLMSESENGLSCVSRNLI